MGMEHHVGVGVDDGVGKFYGEWADQASLKLPLKMTLHTKLRRQSDTCFRILWQIPMLCLTKLWKQRIVLPKVNGHVSSFCTGICFVTMKSVVNKIMCLLAQKTTYMHHVFLLTSNSIDQPQWGSQGYPRLARSSWGWGISSKRKDKYYRASLWVEEGFHPSPLFMVP